MTGFCPANSALPLIYSHTLLVFSFIYIIEPLGICMEVYILNLSVVHCKLQQGRPECSVQTAACYVY